MNLDDTIDVEINYKEIYELFLRDIISEETMLRIMDLERIYQSGV